MDAADFVEQMKALLPPGKAWPRSQDAVVTKVLEGFAPEFTRVQARADALLVEANPTTAEELLDEHEATLGLPDPCTDAPTTIAGRQAAIAARLLADAGHAPPDYIAIGVALGIPTVDITRRPFEPFVAGSQAGTPLFGPEWAHVYFVGYIENLIASPNDFAAGWVDDVATATIDADVGPGPDGMTTADRINFSAGAASRAYEVTGAAVPDGETQFSVWLRSESGLISTVLTLEGNTATESVTIEAGEAWTRHVLRFQSDDATYRAKVGIAESGASSLLTWGARLGTVNAIFECQMDEAQQAHALPLYGDVEELFPGATYFVVDESGNYVTDEDGLRVTTTL